MKERDPLDEFLRQQLSDRTYDFKESYWEAASALIEADARRRRLWWWLGGIGSLVLLAGSLWVLWPAQPGQQLQPLPPLALQPALPSPQLEPEIASSGLPRVPVPAENPPVESTSKPAPGTSRDLSASPPPVSRSTAKHAADSSSSSPAAATGEPVAAGSPRARQEWGAIHALPPWRWPWQQLRRQAASRYEVPEQRGPGRHSLSLTLGGAYNPSWQAGENGGFHPLAGWQYHFRLNRQLRLQVGLLYQGRGGLGLDSTFQSVDYGFGATVETVRRSPRQLHFLELPLTLEWRLQNRHYLEVGAYVAGLLDVSGQQSRVLSESLAASTEQTVRGFGFRQGLQRWDYGLALGYQYYLGEGLRLGASGRYGLRDLSDDTFYQAGRFDRNLQFRLTLSYDLFHF